MSDITFQIFTGERKYYDPETFRQEIAEKEKNEIESLINSTKNPIIERMKIDNAYMISELLGISREEAFANHDIYIKKLTGNEDETASSFWNRLIAAWRGGKAEVMMDLLYYQKIIGNENPAIDAEIEQYKKMIPDTDQLAKSLPESFLIEAASIMPMMLQSMKSGAKHAVAGAFGAASAAALASALSGPLAPATGLSLLAAGAYAGFRWGSAWEVFKIEAGAMYGELGELYEPVYDKYGNIVGQKEIEVPENLRKLVSVIVGGINGALEMAEIGVLLKTIPGLKRVTRYGIMEASKHVIRNLIAKYGLEYFKTIGVETGQEVAQEITQIIGEEVTKYIQKDKNYKTSWDNIVSRILNIAIKSAKAFAVIVLPGMVGGWTTEGVKQLEELKKQSEEKEAELEKRYKEIIDKLGYGHVSYQEMKSKTENLLLEMEKQREAKSLKVEEGIVPKELVEYADEKGIKIPDEIIKQMPESIRDIASKLRGVYKEGQEPHAFTPEKPIVYIQKPPIDYTAEEKVELAMKDILHELGHHVQSVLDPENKIEPERFAKSFVKKYISFMEAAPAAEEILETVKEERKKLAEKIEDIKLRSEIELGKHVIYEYMAEEEGVKTTKLKEIAKAIRDDAIEEYEKNIKLLDEIEEKVGKIKTKEIEGIAPWVMERIFTKDKAAVDLSEAAAKLGISEKKLIEKLKIIGELKKPSENISDYINEARRELEEFEIEETEAGTETINESQLEKGQRFKIDGKQYEVVSKTEKETVIKRIEGAKKKIPIESFADIKIDRGSLIEPTGKKVKFEKAAEIAGRKIEEAGRVGARKGEKIGRVVAGAKLKARLTEMKQKKAIKSYIRKLGNYITKEVPEKCDIYYKEAIDVIRAYVNPKFMTEKKLESRQKTIEFLEKYPQYKEVMPNRVTKLIKSKALNELTIEELEMLAVTREMLQKQGMKKTKYRINNFKRRVQNTVDEAIVTITRGKGIVEAEGPVRIDRKVTPKKIIQATRAVSLTPSRLLRLLDGDKEGKLYELFINMPNRAMDATLITYRRSYKNIAKDYMGQLGLKMGDINRRVKIDGHKFLVQDLMFVYIGRNNPLTYNALKYGNKLTDEMMDKMVKSLDERVKKLADKISEDFEYAYHRERGLRETFIDENPGKDLGFEPFYVPHIRMERGMKPLEEDVGTELLQRYNFKKAGLDKRFTKERVKNIPEDFQKPLRTDFVNLWLENRLKVEYYINHAPIVKELNAIFENPDFQKAVRQQYGDQMLAEIKGYIGVVANPNIFKTFSTLEKVSQTMRRHSAIARLAFSINVMMKQIFAIPLYLAEAGPMWLLHSSLEFATSPLRVIKFVTTRDQQVKETTIERELEEWKRANLKLYGKAIKKISDFGMIGLIAFDKASKIIGWYAVYNKVMHETKNEELAIRKAQQITIDTQTTARAKDYSGLYRKNEFLNMVLQFTNQLNKEWNILVADIPMYIRQRKFYKVALAFSGISLSNYMIWCYMNRKVPEDLGEIFDVFLEFVETVPLYGRFIVAAAKGWSSLDIPPITIARALGEFISKGSISFNRFMEVLALTLGLPYTGPKNIIRALDSGDPEKMFGYSEKKKKRR